MKLSIVLGTYNRREKLEKAIDSLRKTMRGVECWEAVVVDGGSTDGSRAWVAEQPDCVLIGQRGELTGAVRAFNLGFHYALSTGATHIGHFNDDATALDDGMWADAIRILGEDASIGAVAFSFDTWKKRGFAWDNVFGKPYVNYGVFTAEAAREVARSHGDAGATQLWNPCYHTYAADSEAGVWLDRLGYRVICSQHRVHDENEQDELRSHNEQQGDTQLFYKRWAEMKAPVDTDWPAGVKRLHLGCGRHRLDGWLNCDGNKDVNPDRVLDVYDMSCIPSSSLEWIYTSHMIEHIYPDRLPGFLRNCFRILRKTGKLTIATVDFEKCYVNRYPSKAWAAAVYGQTNSTDHPFDSHKQAFCYERLEQLLREAGFSIIKKWTAGSYADIRRLGDFAVTDVDVTLYIEGVK